MLGSMTQGTKLSTRPVRLTDGGAGADDVAICAELVAAGEMQLLGVVESPAEEVRQAFSQPWTDRDATVLVLRDDEPCAVVWVTRDNLARQTFFTVHRRPGEDEAEVRELGVAHALAAARAHAGEDGAPGWTARSGSWIEDEPYFDVLARHGFAPVRRFYQMLIASDSAQIPAEAPPLPEGVEIVVARDESAYRQLFEVDCAAFVDHWNFTPHPYEEWRSEIVDSPNRDPEGMWLLTVDGRPAGICVLEDSRLSLGEGYVGILGVLEEFRGRGLASLLLQRAFVRDRERGLRGTRLGVDAENATGAVGVYEKVGMHAERTRQGWVLTL
jgi:ribosomal protein S18 acetylase RimI-like enzyme